MSSFNPEHTIPALAPELERGPLWLRERRHVSRESFNSTPLPKRGVHLWRYTDPAKFMFERSSDSPACRDDFKLIEEIEKGRLVNGHLAGLVTDMAGREINIHGFGNFATSGVVVMPLSEAVETHFDLVEQHLYALVNHQTGKFEAMNGALWNDGIFIYVPDNTTLEKPIHLLRASGLAGSAQFPRLLVIVGRNSELTLIDEYGGGPTDDSDRHCYSNGTVEVFGEENSRTSYVPLQRHGAAVRTYLTHRARISSGASMLTIPLVFGASLSKQSFGVILNGPGARSNMYGLLFGSNHQHLDNHTLQHHVSDHTESNIDFKTVLRHRANSAYTGLIRIEQSARACEAYQENRNLLLDSGARVETIPELEILNEDVSCSHGATAGPIDPEMLFYLRSRGIDDSEAVRTVVSGFVTSTLDRVPEGLRERIAEFVSDRLKDM